MKKYFWLFGSFFLLLFIESRALGQEEPQRQWSAALFSGLDYSASSSMQGSIRDYQAALGSHTTALKYPFGGNGVYTIGFAVQLSRRYANSPLSLYFNGYGSSFFAGYGFRFFSGGRFTMSLGTVAAGLEYTFGELYQHWNFFGRFGLSSSLITSNFRIGYQSNRGDSVFNNNNGIRFGFEAGIGERYNFSRLPFGIEASLTYANINLIGKSYTTSVLGQGALFSRSTGDINDGKNPNDPNDNGRTIDYFSLKVGARVYF